MPELEELGRVLRLADHNTRVVVLGVVSLGAAAGLLGVFLVLRRRALLVDTMGHATLPGLAAAYLVGLLLGLPDKRLPLLLLGAGISGLAAVGAVGLLARAPRVRPDAALAVVLSGSYGLGVVLLSIAQQSSGGNAAGLAHFVEGRSASMVERDAWLLLAICAAACSLVLMSFKELRLLCFDPEQARALGLPVRRLEALSMLAAAAVAVVGLQAVGLVLVVALFIAPAAAARCWTRRLSTLCLGAVLIGGGCAWAGAVISAVLPRAPTGPLIVCLAVASFVLSLLLGSERGLWRRRRAA